MSPKIRHIFVLFVESIPQSCAACSAELLEKTANQITIHIPK
ncbi:hypothetical protein [Thermodesulfobium acidiphilum]|nr:hypothetical protein [Thermodesulfobium acidiphilum]